MSGMYHLPRNAESDLIQTWLPKIAPKTRKLQHTPILDKTASIANKTIETM